MLLELRVLSGLHKGACLPLDEHAILIGSSEDADIVLLDTGVALQHVLIETQPLNRWILRAVESAIVDVKGHEVETIEVAHDEPARARLHGTDVWLAVEPPETPWTTVDLLAEDGHAHGDPAQKDADSTAPSTALPGSGKFYVANPVRSASWLRLAISLGVALAVVLGMAAVWRVDWAPSKSQERLIVGTSKTVASSSSEQNAERAIAALKELLRDRNLEQQVQYRFQDGRLWLDAVLDNYQLSRFEPIVAILKVHFSPGLQIETRVLSIEQSLPFRVVQVVAGPIPEVLTEDGHRLFLGDSIDGYALVAVKTDAIIFEGKRHVELPW
ncbi:FHA domain-containing protein [Burkholderia cepacia]|uniref:FHA domain-containing protein n=1 Tax=Burkholderia cepacia TaxID=292 RepID=UPI000AA63D23|nr:FHA domain-containing protein [Burkholderia cepacia]